MLAETSLLAKVVLLAFFSLTAVVAYQLATGRISLQDC